MHLKTIDNLQDTFLKKIPTSEYKLKEVSLWTTDRVNEYAQRLTTGKKLIDDNRIKVEPAQIVFDGEPTVEDDGRRIRFKNQITLTFNHPDAGARIYIAEGSAGDPKNPHAERQQIAHQESLTIQEDKIVQIAVQDRADNWSKLQTLVLVNEFAKHVVKFQPNAKLIDNEATIIFPTDPDAFAVTCRSLFTQGLKLQVLTKVQLKGIIQSLLIELERE